MKSFTLLFAVCFSMGVYSQNLGISPTGTPPHNSAALDIDYTDKGLLIPRMTTTQRNAIPSPANSLFIFNTTTKCLEMYNSITSSWERIHCECAGSQAAPTANAATGITQTSFYAKWTAATGATTYYLDVAYDNAFANMVPGYNYVNVGNGNIFLVTGLTCNTTYYYRVRASGPCGISSYSNTKTVTTSACPPGVCGAQVFMTTNLNVGTMVISDGSHTGQQQTNNSVVEKYCYNNVAANCNNYGGLYEWDEAMGYVSSVNCDPCTPSSTPPRVQGICPAGYHIPSDLEWSRYEWCIETTIAPTGTTPLSTFQTGTGWRGTNSNAGPGAKMKMSGGCDPGNNTCWNGTNASGFSALPSGKRNHLDGAFSTLGTSARYWSATEHGSGYAWLRILGSAESSSSRNSLIKSDGFSVRCLKD